VAFLPNDGCPGPEVVDTAERLRLVALDTHWWLHSHDRPEHPGSSCPADSEEEIVVALRAALEGAGGRDVVVLGHHPLQSGGPHGGKFGSNGHVTYVRGVEGSLYRAARSGFMRIDFLRDSRRRLG
jgi:hypothetical protein